LVDPDPAKVGTFRGSEDPKVIFLNFLVLLMKMNVNSVFKSLKNQLSESVLISHEQTHFFNEAEIRTSIFKIVPVFQTVPLK
jgi:hypothetical protein